MQHVHVIYPTAGARGKVGIRLEKRTYHVAIAATVLVAFLLAAFLIHADETGATTDRGAGDSAAGIHWLTVDTGSDLLQEAAQAQYHRQAAELKRQADEAAPDPEQVKQDPAPAPQSQPTSSATPAGSCELAEGALWRTELCNASARYGVSAFLLYDIMDGEGPGNTCNEYMNADGSYHCGLFQFCFTTFAGTSAWNGQYPPNDNRLDPQANAYAAAEIIAQRGTGDWAASGW